jgi:hypothetical protein
MRADATGLYEGVLRKPFTPEMLLMMIEMCLEGQLGTAAIRGAAADGAG